MKLSTIGFYYDFTRLFAKLHGQTTPSGARVSVTNYATHASGYLFENAPGMTHVFLPLAARLTSEPVTQDEDTLDWVGQYLVISGLAKNRARRTSAKYTGYFLEEFRKNRPDVIIISGDTRMQSRAAVLACRELGIAHYYFEQGPFGTTILDPAGVNCTASFAKTFDIARPVVPQNAQTSAPAPHPKVAERKAVRTLDYLVQPLLLGLGCHEIREEKKFFKQVFQQLWKLTNGNKAATAAQRSTDPFVLVVGQVPTDANFSLNSPYAHPLDLVRDVQRMFPGEKILFREHPLFIGSYGDAFYQHFDAHEDLSFSRGTRLDVEIEEAKSIVVVNSTVGMEVVLKHQKPILCLGNASYGHLHGVFDRDHVSDFQATPRTIPAPDHAANWAWFHQSFVPGHFRDDNLSQLTANILERIDAT